MKNVDIPEIPSKWSLLHVDNHVELGVANGAELRLPEYSRLILAPELLFPLITYALFWYFVKQKVSKHCWTSWKEGDRRKQLVNTTTSFLHATISFLILTIFFCIYTEQMFLSPLHYYNYYHSHIIMLTVGYFFYDGYDIIVHERICVTTIVLLLHHFTSIFILSAALVSKKFMLSAFWAMFMEVSSVFLHARSILNMSKLSSTPSYQSIATVISYLNILSFIVFRFGVQMFLFSWAYVNRNNVHPAYLWISCGGGVIFLIVNISLFLRILYSDSFLKSSIISPQKLNNFLDNVAKDNTE